MVSEQRLTVFGKRVLRRLFGPAKSEVTGGWRKLHNEEFHNLYSLPSTSIIRMIKSRRNELEHAWKRRGMLRGFRWESQKERDN
jgi:hypothetical protein